MADPTAATITQLKNIQSRTGRTIAELHAAVAASGAVKHGERRSWLMANLGLGHGDANVVVHFMERPLPDLGVGAAPAAAQPAAGDPLADIYTGAKAGLGHGVMAHRRTRRRRTSGSRPATKDSVEISSGTRASAAGQHCQATTRITSAAEVAVQAYDAAG
jgi:hypothetical protein